MPTKIQAYSQMADHAATQITGSYQGWTEFLQTAARLYKYPYSEQLMIYAQRPDATACAEYDFWNNRMGRYEYCLIAGHKVWTDCMGVWYACYNQFRHGEGFA